MRTSGANIKSRAIPGRSSCYPDCAAGSREPLRAARGLLLFRLVPGTRQEAPRSVPATLSGCGTEVCGDALAGAERVRSARAHLVVRLTLVRIRRRGPHLPLAADIRSVHQESGHENRQDHAAVTTNRIHAEHQGSRLHRAHLGIHAGGNVDRPGRGGGAPDDGGRPWPCRTHRRAGSAVRRRECGRGQGRKPPHESGGSDDRIRGAPGIAGARPVSGRVRRADRRRQPAQCSRTRARRSPDGSRMDR
jgi:hypothetical protein